MCKTPTVGWVRLEIVCCKKISLELVDLERRHPLIRRGPTHNAKIDQGWTYIDTVPFYYIGTSEFQLVQSKRLPARPRLGIKVRLLANTNDTISLTHVISVVVPERHID
jgi:predicted aldo/keto reductase-like oxidoreductase